jgi:hypothetical protein
MIQDHLRALRADSRYKYALIATIIEANMSYRDAYTISQYFSPEEFAPVINLCGDTKQGVGVRSGPQEKARYVKEAVNQMKRENIVIEKNLIGKDPENFLIDLRAQLHRYEAIPIRKHLGEEDEHKIHYSGKKSGKQDDKSMCFQMAIFWPFVQCSKKGFIEYIYSTRGIFELFGS